MVILHLIILALVQGITEFLPVSSSGHLLLTHNLFGEGASDLCWEENRTLDVAVHIGTLLSVLVYFRKDIISITYGFFTGRAKDQKFAFQIILASIPVIIVGLGLQMLQPSFLCLIEILAWTTLIFGILLGVADRFPDGKSNADMTFRDAALIGLAQCCALIPGTSRSGITMTMSRFLGYSRTDSAQFSMFLAIVAISGAGTLGVLDLIDGGQKALTLEAAIAAILAFISGWVAIALMMGWLKRSTFKPFVIYRIILGIALLGLIYSGIL